MRICLDLETTGFDPNENEILQIAVCDWDGRTLLASYVKPERTSEWPKAAEVNGITPESVATAPTFSEIASQVQEIIDSADELVIYNAAFDSGFLRCAGISLDDVVVIDAMREFAKAKGEWSEKRGDWRWHRLSAAVAHVGFEGHVEHDALGDVRATIAVQKWCDEQAIGR